MQPPCPHDWTNLAQHDGSNLPKCRLCGVIWRHDGGKEADCRANRKHEWYRLLGALVCRQCGLQVLMKEPASPFELRQATWRTIELDAELRGGKVDALPS